VPLFDLPTDSPPDTALAEVASTLLSLDPDGSRIAKVFRATFDQLYDGQHTGRFRLDQLFKTEKTHFGTLIEINLQREFKFDDGDLLDFNIAGHEVDCKYSHTGAWMLPMESFDQVILGVSADDQKSSWSAGLVRVTEANRRTSENRDKKTGLNSHGREQIRWLHRLAPMQPNALLQLTPSAIARIFAPSSGQKRLNELFRIATHRRLSRNIIATVAQQDDYMKRVRYNGGSRSHLQPEGYLILGGDYSAQRQLAVALGTAVPEPGEFVSLRVVPTNAYGVGVAHIENRLWRAAATDDVISLPAPTVRA
jgi:hypothetical protein